MTTVRMRGWMSRPKKEGSTCQASGADVDDGDRCHGDKGESSAVRSDGQELTAEEADGVSEAAGASCQVASERCGAPRFRDLADLLLMVTNWRDGYAALTATTSSSS